MIVAILAGGDWYDASVEHLVVPPGRDPHFDVESYPGYDKCGKWLEAWLIAEYGYSKPTGRQLTIIDDR